ncbi:MAG: hypothetical protein U0Q16_21965 [Bryobacteraceae bacterium]
MKTKHIRILAGAICFPLSIARAQQPETDAMAKARAAIRVVYAPEQREAETGPHKPAGEKRPQPTLFRAGPGVTGMRLTEDSAVPMVARVDANGRVRISCGTGGAAQEKSPGTRKEDGGSYVR